MGARSVAAIVIQSTIEILVGGDLILLGLVLRQVALPLEAACWWRWRLSRMDADAALTLARACLPSGITSRLDEPPCFVRISMACVAWLE